MRRNVFLILICSGVLFALFQNFTVPARVLPVHRKFESNETQPTKRLRDFVKYEVGDEIFKKIDRLKSKLQIDLGARDPASEEEPVTQDMDDAQKVGNEEKQVKYTLANLRTIRVRDENSEFNCRVDSRGLNLVFEQKFNSNSSYVLEHNTEQQKSQAKIQFTW